MRQSTGHPPRAHLDPVNFGGPQTFSATCISRFLDGAGNYMHNVLNRPTVNDASDAASWTRILPHTDFFWRSR